MKRLWKIAAVAAWTVCGAYGSTATQAQALYSAHQFEQAYTAYASLVAAEPANAELNFYLGRSALETKRYDEALAAFERVLMLDPAHARTRLERARVYFETGQLELANMELEWVLNATLPSNVREAVLAFKARVDDARAKHRFGGSVAVGIGYDTNINNDIGKREFLIPSFGGLFLEGSPKKSDSFTFGMLGVNHSYDMGLRGGWSMEQSGVVYSKLHRHTTENNLALFSLSTAPTYKAGGYSIGIPVGFDKVYLDGKGYLGVPSVGVRGAMLLNPTLHLEGEYSFRRSYYSQNKLLDTRGHHVWGALRKVFVPEDPWMVALRAGYTRESEVYAARTDVDASKWRYGVEVSKALGYGAQGTLGYLQTVTRYSDQDAVFLTKRKDTRNEFTARVQYPFSKRLGVSVSVSYVDNSSNHAPFDYDKVTTIASVVWGF